MRTLWECCADSTTNMDKVRKEEKGEELEEEWGGRGTRDEEEQGEGLV